MLPFKVIDLRWSATGDLSIGPDGDLEDTTEHNLLSFIQEAKTRMQSELYDWALHPHIGASLKDLIGEPNNKQTAEIGRTRIQSALTRDGFCNANLIKISYVPVSRHHLMYRIKISLPDISAGNILELNLLLDIDEFTLTFF